MRQFLCEPQAHPSGSRAASSLTEISKAIRSALPSGWNCAAVLDAGQGMGSRIALAFAIGRRFKGSAAPSWFLNGSATRPEGLHYLPTRKALASKDNASRNDLTG